MSEEERVQAAISEMKREAANYERETMDIMLTALRGVIEGQIEENPDFPESWHGYRLPFYGGGVSLYRTSRGLNMDECVFWRFKIEGC